MRDKKDNATFDLPGFGQAMTAGPVQEVKRARAARIKNAALKQVQLELLEPSDNTGLPVWRHDADLDLTGLPVWAPT
jgi:hypothetical protein